MTIFELVKLALDELYEEAKDEYGGLVDDEIKNRMSYLTKNYGMLNSLNRIPVDYRDPATRFAYVYKYVASHGDYVVQILQMLKDHLNGCLFQSSDLRVSCIGGGPGSDIIAVLKYLDDNKGDEPVTKITCHLVDREQAWGDTWTEFAGSLRADIRLDTHVQPLDVTDPDSWRIQKKFLKADLFTMSYFVSEVFSLDETGVVREFWSTLFQSAKPGSIFLYDDNSHKDFDDYFDQVWKEAGLECLLSGEKQNFIPRLTEQKSQLLSYTRKFGQSPKLKGYLTYRVLRKPLE